MFFRDFTCKSVSFLGIHKTTVMSINLFFPAILLLLNHRESQALPTKFTNCPGLRPVYVDLGHVLTLNLSYECPSACNAVAISWIIHSGSGRLQYYHQLVVPSDLPGLNYVADERAILILKDSYLVLVLSNVTYKDTGIYSLHFSGDWKAQNVFIDVIVQGPPVVNFRNDRVVDVERKKFKIICDAEGQPAPTNSLYHNGTKIATNITGGVYTISDVGFQDAGNYTCVASSRLGTTPKTMILQVKGTPMKVRFKNKNSVHWGTENFKIICVAMGYGTPVYYLYHNSTMVPGDFTKGVYTISEVKYSNSGNYTCVAKNVNGVSSKSSYLNVKEATLKITSTHAKVVYVELGKDLLLDVSYHESVATPFGAQWYHGADKIVDGYTYMGRSDGSGYTSYEFFDERATLVQTTRLFLGHVTLRDNGTYKVVLEADYSPQKPRRVFDVIVQDQPVVKIQCNKDVIVRENETIECECSAIKGNPKPWIEWYNTDGHMQGAQGYSKKTLSLKSITAEQAGTYKCVGKSLNLIGEETVTISVKCSPSITVKNSKRANLGMKYFYIVCSIRCLSKPKYTIFHNGTKVTKNVKGGVYTVPMVKYSDAGKYTCFAESSLGVASSSFDLVVRDVASVLTPKTSPAPASLGRHTVYGVSPSETTANPSKSDRSTQLESCKEMEKKWKSKWYLILITILCGALAGFVIGFVITKIIRRRGTQQEHKLHLENAALVSTRGHDSDAGVQENFDMNLMAEEDKM